MHLILLGYVHELAVFKLEYLWLTDCLFTIPPTDHYNFVAFQDLARMIFSLIE